MKKHITRPGAKRSSAATPVEDPLKSFEKKFKDLCFVNDVVENVVHDIMDDMDPAEMENGLEGGVLKCSHTTPTGNRIEISAIDMEHLASPDIPDMSKRKQVEDKMHHLADSAIASLGNDTLASLFDSADTAAADDDEFLAVHEIDDISFFTVISHDKDAK